MIGLEAKAVQIQSTLEASRLEGPKKIGVVKNLHGVLHASGITFHDLLDIALSPSKRGGSHAY